MVRNGTFGSAILIYVTLRTSSHVVRCLTRTHERAGLERWRRVREVEHGAV